MAPAAASSSLAIMALLFFLLAAVPSAAAVLAADDGTTHLHLFMHDVVAGSNPTAVQVIKGPAGSASVVPGMAFGDTKVIDDALTETSSPTSAAVGRAQGLYMMSSQSGPVLMVCANLLLTTGDYNGSTIAVLGRDDVAADVRELAVVGGTGRFRMATGYVLWKTTSMNGPDATIELDVFLTTGGGGGGAIDSSAPVSPVGGGGGSSGAAGRMERRTSWVNACVVAVLVAVVGSYYVW